MKKSIWFNLFLVGVITLLTPVVCYGANCNSQAGTLASPADFNLASTWSCGVVPGSSDQITITNYVTRTGNQTFEWGTQTITINAGGYLKIVGNLTIQGGGEQLIINNGGTLEVTGTLTIQNGGPDLEVNSGGTLKAGTMRVNYDSNLTLKSGSSSSFNTLIVGNSSTAVFANAGTAAVSGSVIVEGPSTNTGTMTVGGSFTVSSSGSASMTNGGSLTITGNASSSNTFKVTPGGYTYVGGSFTTSSNEGLTVGTDVSPIPYASMVIRGDLLSGSSGDVRVKDNGRLAVFGDFEKTTSNGGILLNVEAQGQVYIHGNIDLSGPGGGGNIIDNANTTDPYGLYYDGNTSNVTVDSNHTTSAVMQTTNPTFYSWIASQPGSPFAAMPITLRYFRTGLKESEGIVLEWATETEKDFDYFEVQTSTDGVNFNQVSKVKGAGESTSLKKYSYLHTSPSKGRNYYRLKSVDIDQTATLSEVVAGYWNGDIAGLSVYPNPVTQRQISIKIGDGVSPIKAVALYDQRGTMVWQGDSKLLENVQLPESISSGIYLLTVTTLSETRLVRLIVR